MSYSYSGNPADSALDEIRFLVWDTDPEDVMLSDEEINYAIAQWNPIHGSNLYTASAVAEMIAARFAREVTVSADGVSIQMSELQQKYKTLAEDLRDQHKLMAGAAGGPDVGGILFGETYDTSIAPLVWAKGMNDNNRAGRQDYGGTLTSADQNGLLGGQSGLVTETP